MTRHDYRFPNESEAYRSARDRLLVEELELRDRLARVAEQRRALPRGGALKEDYEFDELSKAGEKGAVRLSDLFAPGKDSLILYSYMFSADMARACPLCTSLIDGFDATAPHLAQRANLAVVAKSPIERIHEVASARGWRNLRLLSSGGNTYNADYNGENAAGAQLSTCNVFHRTPEGIHHSYATELVFLQGKIEGDSRHVDLLWPLWNLLDLTPEGRGRDWYPQLVYES